MTAERAEIAGALPAQLELVESMSVLVLAAAKRGAEAVPGVYFPNVIASRFGALGLLVWAFVKAEMLQRRAAPALAIGAMLVVASAARDPRAGFGTM
jgi:hypothetical protein